MTEGGPPTSSSAFWSPRAIAGVLGARCGGRWLAEPPADVRVFGASIDTRELRSGQVFFALAGQHTDGHAFVADAAGRGAPIAVVERADVDVPRGLGVLLVDSAEGALVELARARRRSMGRTRVIGVTGSVGKTTTVRLIEAAASAGARTSASIKSHNNRLGVSLTLLNAPNDAEVIVSEVGTSSPGEIAPLAELIRPDIAVITSIGRAHLEALGSIEGVAREKAELVRALGPDGIAIVPAGIEALERHLPAGRRIVRLGHEGSGGADAVVRTHAGDAHEVRFEVRRDGEAPAHFRAPMPGTHAAWNAALAALVARELGLDDATIARGLPGVEPAPMRGGVERIGPVRVIDDAYNANPESMAAAIELLASLEPGLGGRRVAVLGDMLELGGACERCHRGVLDQLDRAGIEVAVLMGRHMRAARDGGAGRPARAGERRFEPEASDDACVRAAGCIEPGDLVLVKASRSVRLERVTRGIGARFGEVGDHGGAIRVPVGTRAAAGS